MQTLDGQAKSRITSENSFSSKEYSRLDGQIAKLWGKRQVPYTTLTDLPRERINLSYSVQVNNFITQKCSFLQVVPMNSRWLDCFARFASLQCLVFSRVSQPQDCALLVVERVVTATDVKCLVCRAAQRKVQSSGGSQSHQLKGHNPAGQNQNHQDDVYHRPRLVFLTEPSTQCLSVPCLFSLLLIFFR